MGRPFTQSSVIYTGAVELRNTLNTAFAVELPATAIMDYPTMEALTGHLASLMAPSALGMTGACAQCNCGSRRLLVHSPRLCRGLCTPSIASGRYPKVHKPCNKGCRLHVLTLTRQCRGDSVLQLGRQRLQRCWKQRCRSRWRVMRLPWQGRPGRRVCIRAPSNCRRRSRLLGQRLLWG